MQTDETQRMGNAVGVFMQVLCMGAVIGLRLRDYAFLLGPEFSQALENRDYPRMTTIVEEITHA